ncbi:MAG: hypothetical protein LBD24_07880 [Spirochaetaceae bacterium]|nr:hypothetical protein [Spirochaetaceae bacterium]
MKCTAGDGGTKTSCGAARRRRVAQKRPAERLKAGADSLGRGAVSGRSLFGAGRMKPFKTVGDGAKRSRAWAAAGPLTGQGVAPFGNNRRPCLKQPEAELCGER